MGLKSLMEKLKQRATDTPDTSEKSMVYQLKAPVHAGCTPDTSDTPHWNDARVNAFGEAVSDPIGSEATEEENLTKPVIAVPDWRCLDRAYLLHHFKCPTCTAAGLGYGLRCGVGAALWTAYSDTSS